MDKDLDSSQLSNLRKMQTKTVIDATDNPVEWLKFKTNKTKSCQECRGTETLMHCYVDYDRYNHFKK